MRYPGIGYTTALEMERQQAFTQMLTQNPPEAIIQRILKENGIEMSAEKIKNVIVQHWPILSTCAHEIHRPTIARRHSC